MKLKQIVHTFIVITLLFVSCSQFEKVKHIETDDKINEEKTNNVVSRPDSSGTGEPIKLQKEVVILDETKVTKVSLKRNPIAKIANENIRQVQNLKKVRFPINEHFKKETSNQFVKPKDSLLIGLAINVKQPKPIKAPKPFYRDNAAFDIQYIDINQIAHFTNIYASLEDRRGNIWFGSYFGGVAKYDGVNFSILNEEEGFPSNSVWSMFEDSEGNIWFGHMRGKGITKYDGKTFINYSGANGFSCNNVWDIMEDSKGNLWFGTDKGAVKFNNGLFTFFTTENGLCGNSVLSLQEDANGNIWFGTRQKGLSIYDGVSFISYPHFEGVFNDNILSLFKDSKDNIWIGSNTKGACMYDGEYLTFLTEKDGLVDNRIRAIKEDMDGSIWFATGGGLCKYDGATFCYFSKEDGLFYDVVSTLLIDSKNNIIATTEVSGIAKFKLNSFEHYTTAQNLKSSEVYAIYEDSKENLWFALNGGGLCKYDGVYYTHYGKEEGLSSNVITRIIEDHNNNLWLGTLDKGLIKFDGKQFIEYNRRSYGLQYNNVFSVLEDRHHNIWFTTQTGGVTMFDGNEFHNYKLSEDIEKNTAFNIFEDHSGDLWFATQFMGVCKYSNGEFTFYTKKEGLVDNFVWSIFEDHNKELWFGTEKGISKYNKEDDSFTNFSSKDGLLKSRVMSILEDGERNLWVATDSGLNTIKFGNNSNNLGNETENIDYDEVLIIDYKKSDGLKSIHFYEDSVCLDNQNNLWWGTSSSLVKLDLNTLDILSAAPKIQLNTIEINEEFIDFNALQSSDYEGLSEFQSEIKNGAGMVEPFSNYPEELYLPYNFDHLNFKFSAIDWSAPHNIKYSYKVDGLDKEWSIPSSENKADYRNIPFGTYMFNVKAAGKSGQWGKPLQYAFTISPPWWYSTWAVSGYAIMSILLLLGSFKWYAFRMKKKQTILENLIEERTQTIVKQKEELSVAYTDLEQERNKMELKALLNQINPHFIFNALNSIQQFVISNNVKTSLDYFNKFGKLIRSSLEHSEMKYVSIDEEIQVIRNYIDLENLRFSNPVILNFNTNNIDIYNIKIPPMFIQPIVENAIIHGLSEKEKDKIITIDFEAFETYVLCSIVDNGLGRKRKKSTKNRNSGLVITQKRLKSVWHKSSEKYFKINIKDLKEPTGTKVQIKLPKDF